MSETSEEIAMAIMSELGMEVRKIPEGTERSPDFEMKDGDLTYYVELKEKGNDPAKLAWIDEELTCGKVTSERLGLNRQNRFSNVIAKAVKQLKRKRGDADLCLVWIRSAGLHPTTQTEQARVTLYGIGQLFDFRSGDNKLHICYYFTNSDFYNFREVLDGAIVSDSNGLQLCVNTLSPRSDVLRGCKLASVMRKSNALIDPDKLEQANAALVVDAPIDRSKKGELLRHVREKYGLGEGLTEVAMGHYFASIIVPNLPFPDGDDSDSATE